MSPPPPPKRPRTRRCTILPFRLTPPGISTGGAGGGSGQEVRLDMHTAHANRPSPVPNTIPEMPPAATPHSSPRVQNPPLAAAAIALLDQCSGFVRNASGPAYISESRVLKGGTIGKHLRHSLDHFRAALDGATFGTVVEYDRRERNVPMETDPAAALAAIESIRGRLCELGAESLATPIRVRVMLTGDGAEAELGSTLGRELAFATHHAVHHNAMLGAIAAEFGIQTGAEFGKAPSTINHALKQESGRAS